MSARRFRRLSIAAALAVAFSLYFLGMGWSFHRERQAQFQKYTLLLKKIETAREKSQQLQTRLEQRRLEILLRQRRDSSPGDFWMPGELDRLRMKRNAHREG